jgi:anti-sigma regulatory factor (Ser/Thr protein kinase)
MAAGGSADEGWHSHSLDLQGTDTAALAEIRRWIATELAELGRDHVTDVIQVADELASNAYEHADGPCAIHLRRQLVPCLITIEVEDPAAATPTVGRSRFGEAANRGRGLVLVEHVAQAWGVRDNDRGPGSKTVWAEINCDERPCDDTTPDGNDRRP